MIARIRPMGMNRDYQCNHHIAVEPWGYWREGPKACEGIAHTKAGNREYSLIQVMPRVGVRRKAK